LVHRHLLKVLELCQDSEINGFLEMMGNFFEPLRQAQVLTGL
jgi:hypothetical protein